MSNLDGWREEKQSAWLYRELAQCEPDPRIAELFGTLASAADYVVRFVQETRAAWQGADPKDKEDRDVH